MAIETAERSARRKDRDRSQRHLQDAGRAVGEALRRRSSASSAGGGRSACSRGPIVLAAMLLIPFDLDPNQHRLAAILAFVIVWWVTEAIPIPVTALLGVTLCALLEATPPPEEGDSSVDVVFSLFTDDTIFLFIGSFIIAQAMLVHGLHRRLAYRVLAMRQVGGSTFRIILAFGLIGAVTSPVMSNTAAAAMMLPIALGVMGVVGGMVAKQAGGDKDPERLRFGAALMLVITYGITVGGLLLPIGSPPNLIGRELLEAGDGRADHVRRVVRHGAADRDRDVRRRGARGRPLQPARGQAARRAWRSTWPRSARKLGPLTRGEKNTLFVLAFALVGWFLPGRRGHDRGRRLGRLQGGERGGQRGHRGDPRRLAALRAARGLGAAALHAELEPGGRHRLGHRDPVRRRDHARHPAERDRAGHGRWASRSRTRSGCRACSA